MDTTISSNSKFRNVLGASFILIFFSIFEACQPRQSSLVEGKFESYVVDRGNIESFEVCEGYVEPANEVLLLSPASSIVKKIKKGAGQQVTAGEVIIELDTKPVTDKIEQLNDQLAVAQNNLEKTRLNARSTKADLLFSQETKKLKIASIKSTLSDQKQLLDVGGISQAQVDKTNQELILANKDLQLAEEKNAIRLAQLAAEEKGLLLQIEMRLKELSQQRALLKQMQVKASADGIILSVHAKEGEKIQGEKLLVSLSDLSRLKVEASISEKHRRLIKIGRKAYVKDDNKRLQGRISSILPRLDNGNLRFSVVLTESDQSKLIPNQKIELYVVKASRNNVLRIKKGELIEYKDKQRLYKVSRDSAIKQEITFGLITDEFAEITEGAREGCEIVIATSSPLSKLNAIKIERQN
ncbi:Barrel-sandwich domain of CusB or HlyD membrane-fusion [Saccharicrinis carchari]|uniref:Barrel-sandwich domain of CusB or HlyD membrane-fusion n=1 Tax=Saccharicrinis carchari TaxID=1168039 RepID=A0A521EAX1_SACCC|nr:HlyD family efflux transporter periplasmic adaptor subunit [Saccharicrinis carchari]SMO81069.1 Barrel-sandwich domain of CusB or HlyD membrane-fusion [Saccharicrinis carchari]